MEVISEFFNSMEFAAPAYFWIAAAAVLFLIFFPLVGKKRGLAIDLKYWNGELALKNRRFMVLTIPVVITSILMAGILSNPQLQTRPVTNIYGYPVMLVVDVSGSMGVGYSEKTPFGQSYEIFTDLISRREDVNFGLLMFSTDRYIARYFINKNELFADTLENREEVAYISVGTQISGALSKAHDFFTEHIDGEGGKAVILISDMDTSTQEWRNIVEEMTQMSLEGIASYMITPYDAETIIRRASSSGMRGSSGIDLTEVSELTVVAMDDKEGIEQIIEEISSNEMCLIREDERLVKKSLIPYFVIPSLAIVVLCLILSETRFRKIP